MLYNNKSKFSNIDEYTCSPAQNIDCTQKCMSDNILFATILINMRAIIQLYRIYIYINSKCYTGTPYIHKKPLWIAKEHFNEIIWEIGHKSKVLLIVTLSRILNFRSCHPVLNDKFDAMDEDDVLVLRV